MEFPLEIFQAIYWACDPQTVYSIACTCHTLSALVRRAFKVEKALMDLKKAALMDHKKAFKSTVELLNTKYEIHPIVSDVDGISIRYEPETNRKIGYRIRLCDSYKLSNGEYINTTKYAIVIVSSMGPRLNVDWEPEYCKYGLTHYEAQYGEHHPVYSAFDWGYPVDPETEEFIAEELDSCRLSRIELF
ncbi:hypothetical protein MEL_031 [Melbournevirus]|uniref:hypothetical protein n=1 Tax=Melbournevirus TaxID=1560514 RepID=UPI00051F5405|nr:hypothetical protein MEL_031 [Melbournevirus]AIT54644.1 hypothetical protein MEL_031 [Melbournevirus]